MSTNVKAFFHLPGLFEFYELYKRFLPLFYKNREWFYDWAEIGSVYGAPADCIWGGGRVGFGYDDIEDTMALMSNYGISMRLTFSNSLLREEHLSDAQCNDLCKKMEEMPGAKNGVIVHSELLHKYIRKNYPKLYVISSTTKVITDHEEFLNELRRDDIQFIVPDFRLNKSFGLLESLIQTEKEKIEFLCNECCYIDCTDRKVCYENVSRKSLGEECDDHICRAPKAGNGYRFSDAMTNPGFIGTDDILEKYLPMGFSNFKIEGRGLGSAVVLEMLLYYLTKPEYRIRVRECIYLDSSLDLF